MLSTLGPIWPIHVINLDRAGDRMAAISDHLDALGLRFSRIAAVDGHAVPAEIRHKLTQGAPRYKRPLTPAEIGCTLSHLLVWDRIARGPAPVAIVLEDDARLRPGAGAQLAALAAMPVNWDMLKLCHSNRTAAGAAGVSAILPRRMPPCTIGYAITRAAAAQLVMRWVPFSRPVDNQLTYWWEHGACVKIAVPALGGAAADHADTSAIAAGRVQKGGHLRRLLANLGVQAGRRIASIRHRGIRPRGRSWPDSGPVTPALPAVLALSGAEWIRTAGAQGC